MKRYIFEIQYNKSDDKKLWDKYWINSENQAFAKSKIRFLFPGVYRTTIINVSEEEYYG